MTLFLTFIVFMVGAFLIASDDDITDSGIRSLIGFILCIGSFMLLSL